MFVPMRPNLGLRGAGRQADHIEGDGGVLGHAVALEAFEQVVAQLSARARTAEIPARGSHQVCLDGNVLRGTIPFGHTSGRHLLAAYHADQGVGLAPQQVTIWRSANSRPHQSGLCTHPGLTSRMQRGIVAEQVHIARGAR